MSKLKEIKSRISSITSTMKITSAMKSVAAAKLKKEQRKIDNLRPYADKLSHVVQQLVESSEVQLTQGYFKTNLEPKNVLIVFLTSDRGLCGTFNSNILKVTKRTAVAYKSAGVNVTLLPLGKKAVKSPLANEYDVLGGVEEDFLKTYTFKQASEKSKWLSELFLNGTYDRIEIVYNRFINPVVQEQDVQQFLPVKLPEQPEEDDSVLTDDFDVYLYEPSKQQFIENLMPQVLGMSFYRILADSSASEQGARMAAMHQATENAKDLKSDLSVIYNKERQAAVTTEISEISAGAEALSA